MRALKIAMYYAGEALAWGMRPVQTGATALVRLGTEACRVPQQVDRCAGGEKSA